MPVTIQELEQAVAFLNAKSTEITDTKYEVDSQTYTLMTPGGFHPSVKDSIFVNYYERIDETIRKFPGQSNFKGLRHYVEFELAFPGETNQYKDFLRARITDEMALTLLAAAGRLTTLPELGYLLAKTEQLEKEVATLRHLNQKIPDLEKQISALSGRLEALEAKNVGFKREDATAASGSSSGDQDSKSHTISAPSPAHLVHRDSPIAPPIATGPTHQLPKQAPSDPPKYEH